MESDPDEERHKIIRTNSCPGSISRSGSTSSLLQKAETTFNEIRSNSSIQKNGKSKVARNSGNVVTPSTPHNATQSSAPIVSANPFQESSPSTSSPDQKATNLGLTKKHESKGGRRASNNGLVYQDFITMLMILFARHVGIINFEFSIENTENGIFDDDHVTHTTPEGCSYSNSFQMKHSSKYKYWSAYKLFDDEKQSMRACYKSFEQITKTRAIKKMDRFILLSNAKLPDMIFYENWKLSLKNDFEPCDDNIFKLSLLKFKNEFSTLKWLVRYLGACTWEEVELVKTFLNHFRIGHDQMSIEEAEIEIKSQIEKQFGFDEKSTSDFFKSFHYFVSVEWLKGGEEGTVIPGEILERIFPPGE